MREPGGGGQSTVHLKALDVPVVVRASGSRASDLCRAVESAWDWCLSTPNRQFAAETVTVDAFLDSDPDAVTRARADGRTASTDLAEVMHWLSPQITTEAIIRQAQSLLLMHACALAHPDTGATVVLVGPSGMGKTTLARTLGKEFGYLTDESAGIRDDLSVVAYPKPLSLVTGHPQLYKDQVSPASLGLQPPPAETRLAAIVMLDRRPNAAEQAHMETVRNVMAMGLLSPQTSFLGTRPAPLQRIAGMLDRTGGLRTVAYREALDLGPVLDQLMDTRP